MVQCGPVFIEPHKSCIQEGFEGYGTTEEKLLHDIFIFLQPDIENFLYKSSGVSAHFAALLAL